jgi:hypothetical protein
MAHEDDQLGSTVAAFTNLLVRVTEMVRAKSVAPGLLDAFDDASDQIIAGLRGNGIPDQELQSIHKALARLRLAFEERRP